jgi:hypothetical protein
VSAVPDLETRERPERAAGDAVMTNAEPPCERRAVAVVPIEQLQDTCRSAGGADAFLDSVPIDRIDQPDTAVNDERMRAALHELVDDPAEAPVEVVAEPNPHRRHIDAQRST